jgi:tetratricopeptide (TPR) repeat protein
MMQLGRYAEAERLYAEQLAVSRELGHRRGEALAIEGLATVAAQAGNHDEARGQFEAALAIAREVGDRQLEGGLLGSLGMDCMQVGDVEAAREYFRLGRDLCVQTDSRWGIVVADIHLGQCEAKVGGFDRAREHYERGEKGAVGGGMTPLAIYLRRCLGLLAAETGDDAQVEFWYGGALALLETHPHPVYELDTRLQYGQWLSDMGRVDDARAQLEAGREVAEAHGQTFRRIQAEALLAALPGGDPTAAAAAFEEHGATMRAPERIDLHYHLWLAGAGREHLDAARRLMEEHASGYDPRHRDSIIESSRLYRAIRAAAAGDDG